MSNRYIEQFDKYKHLYHYTTVESLLFILINKVLKFNRVDNFNDISEDSRNKYVKFFASCLTFSSEESIPLWHIYANKENGVRLGFPNINIFADGLFFYNENGNKVNLPISVLGKILHGQVEYSDELVSKSPSHGSDFIRVTNVYEMACLKRKVWKYEEELRYFIPDDDKLIKDAKCLYVSLNDEFFDNLIITYNPFMKKYKKKIIEEAVENLSYKNIEFNNSSLQGTIR